MVVFHNGPRFLRSEDFATFRLKAGNPTAANQSYQKVACPHLLVPIYSGESEAIALALEKRLPLLIDEKKGRQIAQAKGVAVIGLLGVLLLAVRQRALTAAEARQAFEEATACGYRVSKQLMEQFIAQLGAMEK